MGRRLIARSAAAAASLRLVRDALSEEPGQPPPLLRHPAAAGLRGVLAAVQGRSREGRGFSVASWLPLFAGQGFSEVRRTPCAPKVERAPGRDRRGEERRTAEGPGAAEGRRRPRLPPRGQRAKKPRRQEQTG